MLRVRINGMAALVASAMLIVLPVSAPAASGPAVTVAATVVDVHTSAPLSGAHVKVYTTSTLPFLQMTTRENGRLVIKGLHQGNYRLRITRSGYQTMAYALQVTSKAPWQSAGHIVMYPTRDPALTLSAKGTACGRPMDPNQVADVYIICSETR